MEYMTVRQAAKKWDRSERWVQTLCIKGRIKGVYRPARDWLIPAGAGLNAYRHFAEELVPEEGAADSVSMEENMSAEEPADETEE